MYTQTNNHKAMKKYSNYIRGTISALIILFISIEIFSWSVDMIRLSFGNFIFISAGIVGILLSLLCCIVAAMIVDDMMVNENKKYGLARIVKLAFNKFSEYDYSDEL